MTQPKEPLGNESEAQDRLIRELEKQARFGGRRARARLQDEVDFMLLGMWRPRNFQPIEDERFA